MYHLLQAEERQQGVQEARRVLKPGGLLLVSFITRYSVVLDVAAWEPEWILQEPEKLRQLLEQGVNITDTGFTDAYFAHPTEVRLFLEGQGFTTLDLVAVEGLTSLIDEQMSRLTGDLWEAWVDLSYRLGKDPSVHGAAYHLAWVGRK